MVRVAQSVVLRAVRFELGLEGTPPQAVKEVPEGVPKVDVLPREHLLQRKVLLPLGKVLLEVLLHHGRQAHRRLPRRLHDLHEHLYPAAVLPHDLPHQDGGDVEGRSARLALLPPFTQLESALFALGRRRVHCGVLVAAVGGPLVAAASVIVIAVGEKIELVAVLYREDVMVPLGHFVVPGHVVIRRGVRVPRHPARSPHHLGNRLHRAWHGVGVIAYPHRPCGLRWLWA